MRFGTDQKVVIIGGGIGGLAAAQALALEGLQVEVLEQASQIGEIGAGIQLGANAFAALDALGVGDTARARSVFTDQLRLMDAISTEPIAEIDVGVPYRERFGNPYAVIHRADIHLSILEAVQNHPNITFRTSTEVRDIYQDENGVVAIDQHGKPHHAAALIGCDGVRSVVRAKTLGDAVRVTGHVVYRAVVDVDNMPTALQQNAPVVWAGPHCHLVHYPLRGGRQYNLVVTFHSREQEQWGVTDGSKEEVLSYFQGIHELPRQMLDKPDSWRRWATADRDPVESWGQGRITILGDAAHPMTQYLAQGACQALEDAVTLGRAVRKHDFNFEKAFADYQRVRIPRTARVLYSAREMGRIYHAKGVERLVRNSLWQGRTQAQFYDSLEWLYGWTAERCLD
ncbi:salicylate hydroxylase [Paenalcaligenes hominis]|uniref:Salicylate hydroxylase n=1 Tax=Paenalcaligenes hominis TaxID=643674 RepID=A0ABX0WRB8_9BURK|nr:3-hydroxybenzoate 6-monooxygenase [Paenalcaligenes hominis]NJB65304.1 salicylate hydroxylase [Paenalcaligenes hominis]GGE72569.1 salicylate hydroxylase [Paenalcaligenes hominis]